MEYLDTLLSRASGTDRERSQGRGQCHAFCLVTGGKCDVATGRFVLVHFMGKEVYHKVLRFI